MSDAVDIAGLLADWPYDPENNVRVRELADGRTILQVRLPFGIEQYERDGRPDGRRPHGHESLMHYHMHRLTTAKAAGRETRFRLSRSQCAELFEEALTYYYRYVHFLELQDWKRTLRDTKRNLRLFDFVKRYAIHAEDRGYLEQWRPYITRVNAVAEAMLAIESTDYDRALGRIERAIGIIESLEPVDAATFHYECERSLNALKTMASQIRACLPRGELEDLEQELEQAVKREEFERAAEIRDRIRSMREH